MSWLFVWKKKVIYTLRLHKYFLIFGYFAFNYPMRPQERICEWQWSNGTDAGSHDNKENVDRPDYITGNTHFILQYRTYGFISCKVITYSK